MLNITVLWKNITTDRQKDTQTHKHTWIYTQHTQTHTHTHTQPFKQRRLVSSDAFYEIRERVSIINPEMEHQLMI